MNTLVINIKKKMKGAVTSPWFWQDDWEIRNHCLPFRKFPSFSVCSSNRWSGFKEKKQKLFLKFSNIWWPYIYWSVSDHFDNWFSNSKVHKNYLWWFIKNFPSYHHRKSDSIVSLRLRMKSYPSACCVPIPGANSVCSSRHKGYNHEQETKSLPLWSWHSRQGDRQ